MSDAGDLPSEILAAFRARLMRDAARLATLRDALADEGAPALIEDAHRIELERLAHALVGAGGMLQGQQLDIESPTFIPEGATKINYMTPQQWVREQALEMAVDAVLKGQKPEKAETLARGCFIRWAKKRTDD